MLDQERYDIVYPLFPFCCQKDGLRIADKDFSNWHVFFFGLSIRKREDGKRHGLFFIPGRDLFHFYSPDKNNVEVGVFRNPSLIEKLNEFFGDFLSIYFISGRRDDINHEILE